MTIVIVTGALDLPSAATRTLLVTFQLDCNITTQAAVKGGITATLFRFLGFLSPRPARDPSLGGE